MRLRSKHRQERQQRENPVCIPRFCVLDRFQDAIQKRATIDIHMNWGVDLSAFHGCKLGFLVTAADGKDQVGWETSMAVDKPLANDNIKLAPRFIVFKRDALAIFA